MGAHSAPPDLAGFKGGGEDGTLQQGRKERKGGQGRGGRKK